MKTTNNKTIGFLTGGKAVAVPGELRGMELAHKKYGKIAWKKLFQPAIRLCREGFKITESLGIALKKWKDDVKNEPCLRYIILLLFSSINMFKYCNLKCSNPI